MFRQEHIQIGIEDSLGDKLEVFIFDTTLISTLLAYKGYSQWCFEVFNLVQLFHTVIEYIMPINLNIQVNQSLHTELIVLDHGIEHA